MTESPVSSSRTTFRILDESELVPVWNFGTSEYEMCAPAEAIRRRIVHGVLYFEPVGDP